MALFIIGIVTFVVAVIGTMVMLGLWVYEDAKVKSDQPPGLWVLIVLLVPNLIGLIIYLLVGRINKNVPSPGTYKKPLIAAAVCLLFAIGLFIAGIVHFTTVDRFGVQHNGSFIGLQDTFNRREWTISAGSANGTSRRTFTLNRLDLDVFHVESSAAGEIILRFQQGVRVETVDISGMFDGPVDLSGFNSGRIEITVEFVYAENVNIIINW